MRTRTTIAATLLALAAFTTGCSSDSTGDKPSTPATQDDAPKKTDAETPDSADTDTDAGAADAEAGDTATLPDFTGQGLQEAQDGAQAAGFYILTSSDATGQGRMQVFDRNWTVCSQTPAPGEHPTDTTVNFDTVKIGETC